VGFQEFVGLVWLATLPDDIRESMTSLISDTRTSFRAEPEFQAQLNQENWEAVGHPLRNWWDELQTRQFPRTGQARLDDSEYDRLALRFVYSRLEAAKRVPATDAALQALKSGPHLSPRAMERFSSSNSTSHPADQFILRYYIEGTRHLFERWQQVGGQRPAQFELYSEMAAEYLRAVTDAENRPQTAQPAYREFALELAMKWLESYEALPVDVQRWHAPFRALLWVTVDMNESQARSLEPLYLRLDNHQHPFLKLLGFRARQLGPWDRVKSQPQECVRRFKTFMDAAMALWKPENFSDQFVLMEVISGFANNTSHTSLPEMNAVHLEYAERLAPTGAVHSIAIAQLLHPWDDDSARRSIALLKQHYGNSSDRGIKSLVESIQDRFPALIDPARLAVAPDMQLLLDLEPHGRLASLQYLVTRGGQTVGLLLNRPKPTELVSIDLASGDIRKIAEIEGEGTALLLDGDSAIVATSAGVFKVNLTSGQSSSVLSRWSSTISSLALADGKLFAGTLDGKVIVIDADNHTARAIIGGVDTHSVRGDSPHQVSISHVFYDAPRKRMLVISRVPNHVRDTGRNAVWAWDLQTQNLSKMFDFGDLQGLGFWASIEEDKLILSNCWLLQYNLSNGKYELLANYVCGDLHPTHKGFMIPITPINVGGRFWWGGSKLWELHDNGAEYTLHITPQIPDRIVNSNGSMENYLTKIDETQFLWYSRRQLYLVRPRQ